MRFNYAHALSDTQRNVTITVQEYITRQQFRANFLALSAATVPNSQY